MQVKKEVFFKKKAMLYSEYIDKVKYNWSEDKKSCQEWLKANTRFQMRKKGVQGSSIQIGYVIKERSRFAKDECSDKIIRGIESSLDCRDKMEENLDNKETINELESLVEKLKKQRQRRIKKSRLAKLREDIYRRVGKREMPSFEVDLDEDLIHSISTLVDKLYKDLPDEELNEIIERLSPDYENEDNIYSNIRFMEDEYGITNLPSNEDGDFSLLGVYWHKGRIQIFLDPIYDFALALNVDPYILYRLVLIHEYSHAFHHRGIDENNHIWASFDRNVKERTRLVEGLAQWYTLWYAHSMDKLEGEKMGRVYSEFVLTLIMSCKKQSSVYQQFLKWTHFSMINMRMAIVTSRTTNMNFRDFDNSLKSSPVK